MRERKIWDWKMRDQNRDGQMDRPGHNIYRAMRTIYTVYFKPVVLNLFAPCLLYVVCRYGSPPSRDCLAQKMHSK